MRVSGGLLPIPVLNAVPQAERCIITQGVRGSYLNLSKLPPILRTSLQGSSLMPSLALWADTCRRKGRMCPPCVALPLQNCTSYLCRLCA